jgi:HEAT repeat protein
MAIRGLGVGASDGYAQWGDPRAYPILVKYIEDKENNEQSRVEACFALSWVATDDEMREVVKKVHDYNKPDAPSQVVRGCYLETLIHRPVPDATAGLIDLLKPDVDLEVRHQAARAIAFGGITRNMIPQIFDKLNDKELKNDATLALLVGADADTAGRALATYEDSPPEAMEDLKSSYNQTFGYWSDKNYENGDVARWVENALSVQHVRVHEALQEWPKLILSRALQEIEFDNGPHSITRVQFRYRLMQDAKGSNDIKRQAAIEILKFMKEKGVLMALRSEPGQTGVLAKQAFFEVMNPKLAGEKIPDVVKADNH